MKILRCSSFLVAAVTFATAADARELTYTPAAGCPPPDEVTSRIDATAPEGRPATLVVTRARGSYHGVVTIGSGDRALERSVDAKSCSAVVDALALVVALDHEPADEPPPASPPVAPSAPPDADREPPHRPYPVTLSLGLLATATKVMHFQTVAGPSLYFDVASAAPTLDVTWLRPSARLSVTRAYRTSGADANDGQLGTRLTSAALDGCPLGWSPAGTTFVASACARAELGALEVERGTFQEGTARWSAVGTTRLWGAAGALARANLLLGSPGRLRWSLGADAGFMLPLRRDRYSWDSSSTDQPFFGASQVPPITWVVALGGGVVLP